MDTTVEIKESPLIKTAREGLVVLIDVMERRWRYFVIPIGITIVLAFIAVKLSPTIYSTKALLLIQSANRPVGSGVLSNSVLNRQTVVDQIAALEAWLKSDEVISGLLPRLVDPSKIADAESVAAQMKLFRSNLSMELVGGSAVEMKLDGNEPNGLASKLELIIERLMEGLTRPEKGILNSQQFIELHQRETLLAADGALSRAIAQAGLADTDRLRSVLKQINDLKLQQIMSKGSTSSTDSDGSRAAVVRNLRSQITDDGRVLAQLELLYAEYDVARTKSGNAHESFTARRSNYVGIFESPENLLIVGRPQDPIYGERPAKKLAIAAVILSFIVGAALLMSFELIEGRLLTTNQFESVAGLPVITRISP